MPKSKKPRHGRGNFRVAPSGLNPALENTPLKLNTGIKDGNIRVEFSRTIAWFEMSVQEAVGMANNLIQLSLRASGQEPLSEEQVKMMMGSANEDKTH